MEDLSLHILDIAENSIDAGARTIDILIEEKAADDTLVLTIADDGKGIDPAAVGQVADPFYTTRTTRRVGLGLPLLDAAARAANGSMEVRSVPGQGTHVTATFQLSHIDRKPLGKISETITTLIAGRPDIDISYRHERNGASVSFHTLEFKRRLGDLPMNSADMLNVIRQYLTREEKRLNHQT